MDKFKHSFNQDGEVATFYLVIASKTSKNCIAVQKGFRHLQSKTEFILLEVHNLLDCLVVGNFQFLSAKAFFGALLMTMSPKIMTSNNNGEQ